MRGLDRPQRHTNPAFDDPPPPVNVAPSFADDTGDAQTWEMGTAIAAITVPEADGTPEPAYAVEGSLPAGIAFDTATRVISGTPTATGNGTITIRASNSEGNADWTITYATTAPASAPSRPDAATLDRRQRHPNYGGRASLRITAATRSPVTTGDTVLHRRWEHGSTGAT